MTLPAHATAAGLARRATRDALHAWRLGDAEETAILIVSELVSNAVIHAHANGTPLGLRLDAGQAGLRIEVHDADPRPPQVRVPAGLEERGRGLLLVEAISSDWGVRVTPAGKAVWAELALETQPEPPPGDDGRSLPMR